MGIRGRRSIFDGGPRCLPAALELIELLKRKHGPVFLHQSGDCCDNSVANCHLSGDLTIGAGDEYLGEIGGGLKGRWRWIQDIRLMTAKACHG